ncbi:hypothetical protein [Vibrio penaeicida]|uniref:Uncharacterized protein n=1 Tax=Vibrio penaeicida TaxID=104609 RepID=A0AAV5NLW2_9VIBR|nr:hypothetical protein [Vibrio penaeicida]RTZ24902.1 hypothetical protein EKN09_01130 [Vibrio penaeicida]GLQ71213.1 hypothetical protein GCM10007932_05730 [Vibrio penaeicida]
MCDKPWSIEEYHSKTALDEKKIRRYQKVIYGLYLPVILAAITVICSMNYHQISELTFEEYEEIYDSVKQLDCFPDDLLEAIEDGKITYFESIFLNNLESIGHKNRLHNLMIDGSQCVD